MSDWIDLLTALAARSGWGAAAAAGVAAGWLGCAWRWRRRMRRLVAHAATTAAAQTRQEVVHEVRMLEHAHLQSGVLEACTLVQRAAASRTDPQRQAWLTEAERSLHRLHRLVQTLHRRAAEADPAQDDRITPGDLERTVVEVCKNHRALGMQISVERIGVQRAVPPAVVAALELTAYNAVINAFRHGRATRLTVQVVYAAEGVELRISDDGAGFRPEARRDGRGIRDMHDRMRRVQGTVEIISAPGCGTTVLARAPLPPAPPGWETEAKEERHDHSSAPAAMGGAAVGRGVLPSWGDRPAAAGADRG